MQTENKLPSDLLSFLSHFGTKTDSKSVLKTLKDLFFTEREKQLEPLQEFQQLPSCLRKYVIRTSIVNEGFLGMFSVRFLRSINFIFLKTVRLVL